ncbi:hypothetical protein [Methanogenium cariaci]|uniref:hypothetical protein n=1 Tax=Methanogenium cariaci TaxID=2197 RepID=UPI00078307F8|nr:hypothetical protein [Methanogenium cariaci]
MKTDTTIRERFEYSASSIAGVRPVNEDAMVPPPMSERLVCAFFTDGTISLCNTGGDSHCTLIRSGTVRPLYTKDHSFVQNLVDKGVITPECGADHR